MAPNLSSGTFKIVALIEGNPPTGIDASTRQASQTVRLYGPDTTVRQLLVSIQSNIKLMSLFDFSGRSRKMAGTFISSV